MKQYLDDDVRLFPADEVEIEQQIQQLYISG